METRQGGRNENQDNAGFIDTPLGLLLVVCDGMGGGPGGRTASLLAVKTVLSVLGNVAEHTSRKDALKFAIEKANDAIYSKASETRELQGMGTTIAAIIVNEKSAVIAHVGDSRIYQLRKGNIVYRSADHSVVADLVRENKLTEEDARNHPRANIITRALGIRPEVEAEYDEVSFLSGDRFVLCTDGIWGAMPQPDLVKQLSQPMGIAELTAATADEVDRIGKEAGGGHDNLTLVLVDATFDSEKVATTHKGRRRWYVTGLLTILLLCLIGGAYTYFSYNGNQVSGVSQGKKEKPKTERKGKKERKGPVKEPEAKKAVEEHAETHPPSEMPETSVTPDESSYQFTPDNSSGSHFSGAPKSKEAVGNNPPLVFHGQDAEELKNAERSRLVKKIIDNMVELKKEGWRSRKKYITVNIAPNVAKLTDAMGDYKRAQVQEILRLVDIERMVVTPIKRNRKGETERTDAWYQLDPQIDHVIKKLKNLEN